MTDKVKKIKAQQVAIKTSPKMIPRTKLDFERAHSFDLGRSSTSLIFIRGLFGPSGDLKKFLEKKQVVASSLCSSRSGRSFESISESIPLGGNKFKIVVKKAETGKVVMKGTAHIKKDKVLFEMHRAKRKTLSSTEPYRFSGEVDSMGRWTLYSHWKKLVQND